MQLTNLGLGTMVVAGVALLAGCDSGPPAPPTGTTSAPASAPAAAPAPAGTPAELPDGLVAASVSQGLQFGVPKAWTAETPSSGMRAAQYKLPAAEGDTAKAECVVFFFGATQGGPIEDNIQRWIGQFDQAAGAEPARTKIAVNGCEVHTLDVEGDFNGGMGGAGGTGFRMLAAIIVTDGGKFFFKCVGPAKSIGAQAAGFTALCNSVSFQTPK